MAHLTVEWSGIESIIENNERFAWIDYLENVSAECFHWNLHLNRWFYNFSHLSSSLVFSESEWLACTSLLLTQKLSLKPSSTCSVETKPQFRVKLLLETSNDFTYRQVRKIFKLESLRIQKFFNLECFVVTFQITAFWFSLPFRQINYLNINRINF